jgi:hypothetical protein
MKGKVVGWILSLNRKAKVFALVALGLFLGHSASALDIVTQDVDGSPIFAPTAITNPLGVGVVAGYCAIAGVLLIGIGCGWLLRIVSQKRS